MRGALENFPIPNQARRLLDNWFQPNRKPGDAYRLLSKPTHRMNGERVETIILAAFVEVFLAKKGHDNPVGFNCLEKMQLTLVPSIFGAMLAGVDVLIIGAGLPVYIKRQVKGYVLRNQIRIRRGGLVRAVGVNYNYVAAVACGTETWRRE